MKTLVNATILVDWSLGTGWHFENVVYEPTYLRPTSSRQIAVHIWRLLITIISPSNHP